MSLLDQLLQSLGLHDVRARHVLNVIARGARFALEDRSLEKRVETTIGVEYDVQRFTTYGVWRKPRDAALVYVVAIGGGGGGGAGELSGGGSNVTGGGGGGGGGGTAATLLASGLPPIVRVRVGPGGSGQKLEVGDAGEDGGESTFGSYVRAGGGAGGKDGGLGGSEGAGGAGGDGDHPGGAGGNGGAGVTGSAGEGAPGQASALGGGGGGGGGGGVVSGGGSPAQNPGGAGGAVAAACRAGGGGTAGESGVAAPGEGDSMLDLALGGGGGGGGSGGDFRGGAPGGLYGAGGGGGGAWEASENLDGGGAGAPGVVIVITRCSADLTPAPEYESSTVDETGTLLTLLFSKHVRPDFSLVGSIVLSGTSAIPQYVRRVQGSRVEVVLAPPVEAADDPTIAYTPPRRRQNPLQDSSGKLVAAFADDVDNNSEV